MRNRIVYTLMLAALTLTQTACDDNKDEYLDEFSTILYLRNSGEIPLTLYTTGENTDYSVIVNKAGTQLGAVTGANVSVMEDAALEIYNSEQGTAYKKLPANCYTFSNTQVDFSSSETYKALPFQFATDEVDKLPALAVGQYVLPLVLSNSKDSINSEKNLLFIRPTVVIPRVTFDKTDYQSNKMTEDGDAELKLNLPLSLPLENKWTFDCTVNVDQELLNKYNEENGTDFNLLPANSYTMNANGKVNFVPGSFGELDVVVRREGLQYGNYVLPLRLAECSYPTFMVDEVKNSCLFGVSYIPKMDKFALDESMIDYFPKPLNEGSIAEMLDGKADTYYHSRWGSGIPLPHYLDFNLGKETTAFTFSYQTRHNNPNGTPLQITLLGSMDGVNFTKIMTISKNLPTGKGEIYDSPFIAGEPFKYLRFSVDKSPGDSFAIAEFSLFTN